MNATGSARADLEQRIETIETGYEFMLAYAAQGRATDKGASPGRNVREYLDKMVAALEGLSGVAIACAREIDPNLADASAAFFAAVEADARIAQAAIRLVLARTDVSSQLIDNLNASIHLRALLTDLFVVDEALKRQS
jgi:alkylation response protein AidB-like acyl-CoA dehydrogenase